MNDECEGFVRTRKWSTWISLLEEKHRNYFGGSLESVVNEICASAFAVVSKNLTQFTSPNDGIPEAFMFVYCSSIEFLREEDKPLTKIVSRNPFRMGSIAPQVACR